MRPCPGRFTNPVSRKGHVSTQNVPQSFKLLSAHKKKNKHDLVFVLPFHTRSKWVFFSCSGYGGRLGGEDRGGWLQWERQKASRDGYHKARCCTASCPGDDDVRDVHYATGPLVACGHWSIQQHLEVLCIAWCCPLPGADPARLQQPAGGMWLWRRAVPPWHLLA